MGVFTITLFASDMPDDPTHADAICGEYEFYILSLLPYDEAVKEPSRKADNSLENNIPQRALYEIEFVPFYIETAIVEPQNDIQELILLKKMLRQPYLVIKSCTIPPWNSSPNNVTNEYNLPAVVRWNFEDTSSNNKDDGIIEYSARLEAIYTKGTIQPTPITNTDEYTY